MSIFSQYFRLQPLPPLPKTGIRSATGLSRSAIAEYWRRAGLFGRESDLKGIEQFVVQSRLGPLSGLPVPAPDVAVDRSEPTLGLLADHVDAMVAGRDTRESAGLLRSWGFTDAALSEIERTVDNVQDIFGPRAKPSMSDVRESSISQSAFARAA